MLSENVPGAVGFVTEPGSGIIHTGPVHPNVRLVSAECVSVHEAPGLGMAVIYVGVSHQTGKMYVGKKCHSQNGQGAIRRIRSHISGIVHRRCPAIANACIKYRFSWFVIERCTEQEVGEREVWWINEYSSVAPSGYNIDSGGTSGEFHPRTIQKMKAAWQDPTKRMKRIESMRCATSTENTKANLLASQKRKRLALDVKRALQLEDAATGPEQKALSQKFKEYDNSASLRQRRRSGEVISTPSERKRERLRIKAEGKPARRLLQTKRLVETCARKREVRLESCTPEEAESIRKNRRSNENRYKGVSTKAEAMLARRQKTIAKREEMAKTMKEPDQVSFWKRCAKTDRANTAKKQKSK